MSKIMDQCLEKEIGVNFILGKILISLIAQDIIFRIVIYMKIMQLKINKLYNDSQELLIILKCSR